MQKLIWCAGCMHSYALASSATRAGAPVTVQTSDARCCCCSPFRDSENGCVPAHAQLRMYRLAIFFRALKYNLRVSFAMVTIVRNFVYIAYIVHWAACIFYFIARQEGFSSETWVGQPVGFLDTLNKFERCVRRGAGARASVCDG
jgi:hypothetical protein